MKKIRLIASLLIAACLSGCIAAVVAGAAAGLIVYDQRSAMTIERDLRIFHVAQKALVQDPLFRQSRLVIVSYNQVVLLAGQVSNVSLRAEAERTVQKIPLVRHVYDEMTVASPISIAQQTKDTWITSEARSLLLTKKGLDSGSIKVLTEDGVVYLMGMVTRQQANLAVEVARQIKGVQKVVKVFQYIT